MSVRFTKKKINARAALAAAVETLESRQMLSVSLAGGTLTIQGSAGNDNIVVSRDRGTPGFLSVSINGQATSVNATPVKNISINTGDGDDRIDFDQRNGAVKIDSVIVAGAGNDTVTGGNGADVINGGLGNDMLRGSAGGDRLEGGAGNDALYGGAGRDTVNGGAGNDKIYTAGESDIVSNGGQVGDVIDKLTPKYQPKLFNDTPTGYTPAQIRAYYGIDSIGGTGANQTIAIVSAFDAPTIRRDLETFSTEFSLTIPTKDTFQVYYATKKRPQFDAGWATETSMDVQWAHAIAPDAKIIVVEAASNDTKDLDRAIDRAIELLQPTGGVVSMSFGGPEIFADASEDIRFHTAKTANISFLAASGDDGAEVSYPGASPYVLSVGGTHLELDNAGAATKAEKVWSGSGGGMSAFFSRPDYQSGVTSGSTRLVPDVAAIADAETPTSIFNSSPDARGNSGWDDGYGTSLSTPIWAGIVALVNEQRVAADKDLIGNRLNEAVYSVAQSDYAANFHDIITGTNGYQAQVGYDKVTGWGSPKADSLVGALAALDLPVETDFDFAGARAIGSPASSAAAPRVFFGGAGTIVDNGSDFSLTLTGNSSSGITFDIPDPLTADGSGRYSGVGTATVAISSKSTVTYLTRYVIRVLDDGSISGEFYAVSKRGKIIYSGDRPVLYGSFKA